MQCNRLFEHFIRCHRRFIRNAQPESDRRREAAASHPAAGSAARRGRGRTGPPRGSGPGRIRTERPTRGRSAQQLDRGRLRRRFLRKPSEKSRFVERRQAERRPKRKCQHLGTLCLRLRSGLLRRDGPRRPSARRTQIRPLLVRRLGNSQRKHQSRTVGMELPRMELEQPVVVGMEPVVELVFGILPL